MSGQGFATTARKMSWPRNGKETREKSKSDGDMPFAFAIPQLPARLDTLNRLKNMAILLVVCA